MDYLVVRTRNGELADCTFTDHVFEIDRPTTVCDVFDCIRSLGPRRGDDGDICSVYFGGLLPEEEYSEERVADLESLNGGGGYARRVYQVDSTWRRLC
jgi:hypothetical protein